MATTVEVSSVQQWLPSPLLDHLGEQGAGDAERVADHLLLLAEGDAPGRGEIEAHLRAFGEKLQFKAARQSALLEQPLRQMAVQSGEGSGVAATLIDLKVQIEALDPAGVDFQPGWFQIGRAACRERV
mgnify:CR=1 FL=1